jgi:hypothetical protein
MLYWAFLPVGYLLTILIETPILLIGLSPRHSLQRKFFAGWWLTACTYPIVVIVLPQFFDMTSEEPNWLYLAVAETFAPVAECALFYLTFIQPEVKQGTNKVGATIRDLAMVTLANLASFGFGLIAPGWLLGKDNPLLRPFYEP